MSQGSGFSHWAGSPHRFSPWQAIPKVDVSSLSGPMPLPCRDRCAASATAHSEPGCRGRTWGSRGPAALRLLLCTKGRPKATVPPPGNQDQVQDQDASHDCTTVPTVTAHQSHHSAPPHQSTQSTGHAGHSIPTSELWAGVLLALGRLRDAKSSYVGQVTIWTPASLGSPGCFLTGLLLVMQSKLTRNQGLVCTVLLSFPFLFFFFVLFGFVLRQSYHVAQAGLKLIENLLPQPL